MSRPDPRRLTRPRGDQGRAMSLPLSSRDAVAPQFSPAGPAEEDAVLALMREFYALEHLTYSERVARLALHELWRSPALGRVYLIHAEEELAGYVVLTFGFSLEFHGRDALVDELYLRESYRGRGWGTECLRWIEEICRADGVHAVHLEVDHINVRAKRLYHRAGYEDHNRHLLTKWLRSRDSAP